MEPANSSSYNFINYIFKDPETPESLIHRAMDKNPASSEAEILSDMLKDMPYLKNDKDFNENFLVYYHHKKPCNFKIKNSNSYNSFIEKPINQVTDCGIMSRMLHETSGRNNELLKLEIREESHIKKDKHIGSMSRMLDESSGRGNEK